MMPLALILTTQRRIEEAFVDLQREVDNYQRLQNNIHTNIERLRNFNAFPLGGAISRDTLNFIFTLKDANLDMEAVCQRTLREIDSYTAEIAGYLTVLIDECLENYQSSLKFWIRRQLDKLNDLREIKVQGTSQWLAFPTAVATLIPYAIKTRICGKDNAERLVSIRNKIRLLAEPSY